MKGARAVLVRGKLLKDIQFRVSMRTVYTANIRKEGGASNWLPVKVSSKSIVTMLHTYIDFISNS